MAGRVSITRCHNSDEVQVCLEFCLRTRHFVRSGVRFVDDPRHTGAVKETPRDNRRQWWFCGEIRHEGTA